MTDRAPGLDGPTNKGGCFNCGSQEHFAYACPEPTRKEPFGAGVFRQLQPEKPAQGGAARGFDNSRSKGGLVVTRYGPPPPQYPPHTNAWGPGGPYPPPVPVPAPPPNPYGQPPPLPYHPPTQAQPPYPPPYPPAPGGYRPPVHPPPAHSPAYGQYGQDPYQPPPPPPSSYGPPAPYAPPGSYPPPYQQSNPPYPGAPPLGFPGPPPPPSYAPGYGTAVPPVPPPPPAPYLSGSFPPGPHAPGYDAPAPYTAPYPPPPPNQGWQPEFNSHNSQRQRDRRDKRNDRDKGSKNRNHRRDNDNSQRGRGHRRDAPGPRPSSHSRQRTPKPSIVAKDEKSESSKTESLAEAEGEKESKDAEPHDDFAWELEKSFVEVEFKPADPVGKPLAAEWNDSPTIPPAYDAKCIKSAFYDPDNPDAFLASVRDTHYWSDLKRDPVFRYRRGMVAVQFPGSHHEYFTYPCSRKVGAEWYKEREIVPTPSDASLNDAIKFRSAHQPPMSHRQGDSSSYSNGKRSYRELDDYRRDAKRARPSTGREQSPSRYPRRPSPRDTDLQGDPWASQAGEARIDTPPRPYSRDGDSHSPGGYRVQHGDRLGPYGSTQRHDSGYHSAHSAEKHRFQREGKNLRNRLSPPPSVRLRDREASRDRSRGRDRGEHGRDRDRDRGRSPSYSRPRSRTRSPTLRGADSDDESGMSDLEYELLGMERPRKKVAPPKPPIKKPRVKVNDAFSRRW